MGFCELPHARIREPGELYSLPTGACVVAVGVEVAVDHRAQVETRSGLTLCDEHFAELGQLVDQTPDLVAWLRTCVRRPATQVFKEWETPRQSAAVPLCDLDAVDAADAELAELARLANPALATVRGLPRVPGPTWRVQGHVRGVARRDTAPVGKLAAWCCANLDQVARWEGVPRWVTDTTRRRRHLLTRWPV